MEFLCPYLLYDLPQVLVGFPHSSVGKEPACNAGDPWVRSLGWEDPLEKGKATHSSILAWRIPWTVQSTGSQRAGHNWVTFTFTFQAFIVSYHNAEVQTLRSECLGSFLRSTISKGSLEYGWWSEGKAYAVFTKMPCSHYFILQIMIHFYTKTVKTTIGLFMKHTLV